MQMVNMLLFWMMMIFWMESKLEKQIAAMEEGYYKFSSTEGYFGFGEYSDHQKYPYTIENILIRFLKRNIGIQNT